MNENECILNEIIKVFELFDLSTDIDQTIEEGILISHIKYNGELPNLYFDGGIQLSIMEGKRFEFMNGNLSFVPHYSLYGLIAIPFDVLVGSRSKEVIYNYLKNYKEFDLKITKNVVFIDILQIVITKESVKNIVKYLLDCIFTEEFGTALNMVNTEGVLNAIFHASR